MIGRAITLGGGSSEFGAVMWAISYNSTKNTFARLGQEPGTTEHKTSMADGKTFSENDGVFTCLKSGTYSVFYGGRGSYYSSTNYNQVWKLYVNNVDVTPSSPSGVNEYNNGGGEWSGSLNLTAGDTVEVQVKINAKSRIDGILRLSPT